MLDTKKIRCLGITWSNSEKFNGSNFRESLLKRNEIESFLKRLITGNEQWITYDNNVRKRSWSKQSEAPQTVAKPGLTPRTVMLCGIGKESFATSCYRSIKRSILTSTVNNWKDYAKQLRESDQNWSIEKVVFHHDNARLPIFDDSLKIERTWLENFYTSTL